MSESSKSLTDTIKTPKQLQADEQNKLALHRQPAAIDALRALREQVVHTGGLNPQELARALQPCVGPPTLGLESRHSKPEPRRQQDWILQGQQGRGSASLCHHAPCPAEAVHAEGHPLAETLYLGGAE
jgi:hypothetical protein